MKACLRRNFVPPSFERNQELMREFIKEGKELIKYVNEFFRKEAEFKEKLERILNEKRKREARKSEDKLKELEEKEKEALRVRE